MACKHSRILYLIRHAKSDWQADFEQDFDRPLDARGLKAASVMGKYLQDKSIKVDLVVSSPAKRALHTAQLIAKEIRYSEKKIKTDRSIYTGDCLSLLKVLHESGNSYGSIMLVGHNPTITMMANQLTHDHIGDIPTCGVYAIEFLVDDWNAVAFGMGRCLFFEVPAKSVV